MTRKRRSRGARARCDTSNLCSSPKPVSLKFTEVTIGRFQTLVSYHPAGVRSCEDPVPIALWERTITPRHLRRRLYSPSYTITPRDSSPVAGRRVDAMCMYIDVAQ